MAIYFVLLILSVTQLQIFSKPVDNPSLANEWDNPEYSAGYFQGDMMGIEVDTSKGAAQLITGTKTVWFGGIVPYKITEGDYDEAEINLIQQGMRFLEDQVKIGDKYCIKIVPHTNEPNWVRIYSGSGCSSYVGKSLNPGEQTMSLKKPTLEAPSTCLANGTIAHEFIHALGFHHEQSRPDRDDFVTIHYENITPGHEHNFIRYTTTIDTLGLPYDYDSIMHYSQTAFAASGTKTIVPRVEGAIIGQRRQLSAIDVAEIRKYYNCKA